MARPTFPARNQWSNETPSSADDTSEAAVSGKVWRRSANVVPIETILKPHIVPLSKPTTVGNSGAGNAAALRTRMVQQLQKSGLQDPRVIAAMHAVERHCFIDSALLNQAYLDTSLPIGLQQTISKPSVVARMAELLLSSPAMHSQPHNTKLGRILEIGTGCGYQASVLAHIATEVYSIERLKGLHEKARTNLHPFRIPNIHLILGDGMLGYKDGAPYAAIIAAAGGDAIPQAWIDQLAMGGRIVAPVTVQYGQALVILDKTPIGLQQTVLEPVLFVPLKPGIA